MTTPIHHWIDGAEAGPMFNSASFYTRGEVVTSRRPDPSTSSVDLGFRGPAE